MSSPWTAPENPSLVLPPLPSSPKAPVSPHELPTPPSLPSSRRGSWQVSPNLELNRLLRPRERSLARFSRDGTPAKGESGMYMTCLIYFCLIVYGIYFSVLWDDVWVKMPDIDDPSLGPFFYSWRMLYVYVFHLLLAMTVTSFVKTHRTDPGVIPATWGFHLGDDNKRRRYCKLCHVWKPSRAHHCSTCGRCVLGMDHHCPWVRNCVGFYNRKCFINLILYAAITLGCVLVHSSIYVINFGKTVSTESSPPLVARYLLSVAMVLSVSVVEFSLLPFAKYHFNLVANNRTTIEDLDHANKGANQFSLGCWRNCTLVMGSNPFLWCVPWHSLESPPTGDGVRWNLNYTQAIELAEEQNLSTAV